MRSAFWLNGLTLLLAATALPAIAAPPPPGSGPMVVTWTTWMRAGPTEQSRAIDEIGTGTPVTVQTCEGDWCRISKGRVDGYVMQRYLAASLQTLQPGTGTCFPAQYYTAEGPLPVTICPAKTP